MTSHGGSGATALQPNKDSAARRPVASKASEDLRPALPGAVPAAVLTAIRDDLGFETASLFVRGPEGWDLLERQGPVRPWHAVLDPGALEGTPEAAEYRDARTIPRVGVRLARDGCASVASLPLPDGGRLLLDAARPGRAGGWVERAKPYLDLIGMMSGPMWAGGGALRDHAETAALRSAFASCQRVLARGDASPEDLLDEVRGAVGAAELLLLTDRGADMEVTTAGASSSRGLPRDVRAELWLMGEIGIGAETLRRLAVALCMASRTLGAGFGRDGEHVELLVAGWTDRPALSPMSMDVVARAVSTTVAALRSRQHAVTTVVDRERTRMAYALHDGLTQTVAGAVLELEALGKRVERDPQAVASLERSKTEIRRALAELRGMLFDLSRVEDEKPSEPLRDYVEDVVRRWKLPARIAVEGDLSRIPPRVLSVAYVVIREALANAAKHAASATVTVRIAAIDGDLSVTVGDGGPGFTASDEHVARAGHHIGLEMLRRRVREVGGRLRVESRPWNGTRVIAHLPTQEASSR